MKQLTWGDTVRVRGEAPLAHRPGEIGEVCGIRAIDTRAMEQASGYAIGTVLLLIEFADGKAAEIPAHELEAAP